MATSYKTKYTELLNQHLNLIGHFSQALTDRSQIQYLLQQAECTIENQASQIEKLQAAAVKQIEKNLADSKPKSK